MSTATEITRLQTARNTIRTKFVELGIANGTDKLDALASAASGIENRGAINATVTEGASYTIPKGYHDGSGIVAGIAGGGNYSLQEKNVTPTKVQQSVTSDEGYYGISSVIVAPIPDNYQDVSATTAVAANVLANKIFTAKDGTVTTGTMVNNGAVNKTLDVNATSFTVPVGYHDGSGVVQIATETKSVTPTKSDQDITPSSGKVISKVTVAAIPDAYQDVTGVTATAKTVLEGSQFVDADGAVIEGAMKDYSGSAKVEAQLDVSKTSTTLPVGYHTASTVNIVLEEKSVTPTKAAQNITPTAGKVLSKVSVAAIPDNFIDTTDADAVAGEILDGKFAYINGVKVEGTMANNGSVTATMDGMTTTSVTIPAGFTTGGTVSLTSDIEEALAAI